MVGGEYVPPFGRNILFIYQFQVQVKISDQLLHERYPVFIVIPAEDVVQLILMNSTDQIADHKAGNLTAAEGAFCCNTCLMSICVIPSCVISRNSYGRQR